MKFALRSDPSEKCPISLQSPLEEWFNVITHGLGFLASFVGLIFLISLSTLAEGRLLFLGCIIYGVSMLLLYGASTCYHACRCQIKKRTLKKLDHICIYLLIAGSYTPFTLGPLRGNLGWSLFTIVWAVAFIGIMLKVFVRKTPDWLNSLIYLGMGWLLVIAFKPLSAALSSAALYWILAGGFAYSFGVIFYLWKKLPFSHAIWHLFVLSGSLCHYICIARYVVIKA